jgi:hypothetical protein
MNPAPMEHLPVFLQMQGRGAVVVGGGLMATRKAELLLRCGATVTIVSPALHDELRAHTLGELRPDQAPGKVGAAARREWHDDAHRLGRIGLREREQRKQKTQKKRSHSKSSSTVKRRGIIFCL